MGEAKTGQKPVKPKDILDEQREVLELDGKLLGDPKGKSFATGREKQDPGSVLGNF